MVRQKLNRGIIPKRVDHLVGEAAKSPVTGCWCWRCAATHAKSLKSQAERVALMARSFVCNKCGSRRCPRATSHRANCQRILIKGRPNVEGV